MRPEPFIALDCFMLGLLFGILMTRMDRWLRRRQYLRNLELKRDLRPMPQDRDEAVMWVLRRSDRPLGPTAIAEAIHQPWAKPNVMGPILKRIGAQNNGQGLYSAPKD